MARVTLWLKEMETPHDESAIANMLREISGVSQVNTSINEGKVDVSYSDGRTTVDALKKVLEDSNYQIEDIKQD